MTRIELAHYQLVACYQIVRKEIMREWQLTIFAPLVTLVLYLVVFGPVIGTRVGEMGGVPYIDFIFPGLVTLAIVLNAFNSSAVSLYLDKFMNCHEEWLTARVYSFVVIFSMALGCAVRSIILVTLLAVTSLFLGAVPQITGPLNALLFIFATSFIFSFAGLINAMLARTFDHISFVPNIILVPLTFIGGVFYDANLLPQQMQALSFINPVFFMVDGLRASFGITTFLPVWVNLIPVTLLLMMVAGICFWMVNRGVGLRG